MSGTVSTIPASAIVSVQPNVLATGGNALSMIGLMLTENQRVPTGVVMPFASAANVGAFFGLTSPEYLLATTYFNGFTIATVLPDSLLFAQYPVGGNGAYLWSGNVGALGLTALQALSGTLTVTIDGTSQTSSAINFASAGSYSAAAGYIQAAFSLELGVVVGSITGSVLTVSSVTSGALSIGALVTGSGFILPGTYIISEGTGSGGTGTYNLSQPVTSGVGTGSTLQIGQVTCTYDSVTGAFVLNSGRGGTLSTMTFATGALATSLLMTQATGAYLSQGTIPATPTAIMNNITAQTTNFASFMTVWEPPTATKVLFAQWNSAQNYKYMYVMHDSDVTVASANSITCAGYLITQQNLQGVERIYDPTNGPYVAAFALSYAACLNYNLLNGRTDMAFLTGQSLTPGVTNQTIASNVLGNGYSYYGAYANGGNEWMIFYNGNVSGKFLWVDTYINQIWLNSQLQTALFSLLTSVRSVPFTPAGYNLIFATMQGPAQGGVNFGAIRSGVVLTQQQIVELIVLAGRDISGILKNQGYYIQVLDPGGQVRQARGSPIINFFYCDGQSVQMIAVNSVDVE